MKIYIIRHGETDANVQGRLQGWSEVPLNENGIFLAKETGKGLKDVHFDVAFSSSLMRAKQSAEIILEHSGNNCPVLIDDRIKEINMGDYEGKKFRPGECEIDPDFVKIFFEDPAHAPAFPGGECVIDVMKRTQAFLKELGTKDYETVLVSTHGYALRSMLNFLYDDPDDFWHGHVPYNCVVNIVEASDAGLKLVGDDLLFYDEKYCADRYAKY